MLARLLDPDLPVYSFLESDAFAADAAASQAAIEATAAVYLREIRRRQPEGLYLLGGVCIGGVLAFEIAHQVVAEGGEVAGLFLIDTRYPDRDAEAIERLRRRLVEQAAARVARRQLADGGGEAVPATERPGSGASSADNVTLLDDEEPNPRALQLYRYRPRPFPGRVTLFENEAWHRDHPATEWATVAAGGLEVEVVPGDHRTYLVDHLDVVADRLRTKLAAPVAPAAVG